MPNYSLNGIWVRPNLITGLTGVAEQTNAITYPANPSTLGGNTNFTFDDPLPYILTSQLIIGEELPGRHRRPARPSSTTGSTSQPGVIVKSDSGAGISVVNNAASINIGSRTYINEFDANPNFNRRPPADPAYRGRGAGRRGRPVHLALRLRRHDAPDPDTDQLGQRHDARQRRDREPARPDEFGRIEP